MTLRRAEQDLEYFCGSIALCKKYGWEPVNCDGVSYKDLAYAAMCMVREEEVAASLEAGPDIDRVLWEAQKQMQIRRLKAIKERDNVA